MTHLPIFPSHIRDLTSVSIGLTEQRLHIILGQRLEETGFGGDQIFDEGAFLYPAAVKFSPPPYRVNDLINKNGLVLTDAVGAVTGLHFDRWDSTTGRDG